MANPSFIAFPDWSTRGSSFFKDDVDNPNEAYKFKIHHNDHWDTTDTLNSWSKTSAPTNDWVNDWINDWVMMDEDSLSNQELYKLPEVQENLYKLANLSRADLPRLKVMLEARYDLALGRIPLFKDENGDEYQIKLSSILSLPKISCRFNPGNGSGLSRPLYLLRGRDPTELSAEAGASASLPRYAIVLGNLEVRTTSRYPEDIDTEEPITERTDYCIIVDAESKEMPMWIVVCCQALKDRAKGYYYHEPISPLPIFRGLMKDENGYYDSACILSSLHQLSTSHTTASTAAFSEACDLVRKTRAIRDPAAYQLHKDQFQKYVANELPEDPYSFTIEAPADG